MWSTLKFYIEKPSNVNYTVHERDDVVFAAIINCWIAPPCLPLSTLRFLQWFCLERDHLHLEKKLFFDSISPQWRVPSFRRVCWISSREYIYRLILKNEAWIYVTDESSSLTQDDIPFKLRCAICNNLAINAFRLPCCDQAICESCMSSSSHLTLRHLHNN